MATCPKCGGHLTSRHRCPIKGGVLGVIAMALLGGTAAIVVTAAFDQAGLTTQYDAYIFLGGAAIAMGVVFGRRLF